MPRESLEGLPITPQTPESISSIEKITIDEIKSILSSQLEGKARIKTLELQPTTGGLLLNAELDAGIVGGKISIYGLIINAGDEIAVSDLKIGARGYVKSRIEDNITKFVPAIKTYFENKYGKPVSNMQVT